MSGIANETGIERVFLSYRSLGGFGLAGADARNSSTSVWIVSPGRTSRYGLPVGGTGSSSSLIPLPVGDAEGQRPAVHLTEQAASLRVPQVCDTPPRCLYIQV